MEFIKKYLNLKKLNRREKYIIYGVGGLVGLLIIVQFVITPFIENKNQMQRSLQTKKTELEEMRRLQTEYKTLKEKLQLSQISIGKREKRIYALFVYESARRSGRHQGPYQLYEADKYRPEKQQL